MKTSPDIGDVAKGMTIFSNYDYLNVFIEGQDLIISPCQDRLRVDDIEELKNLGWSMYQSGDMKFRLP